MNDIPRVNEQGTADKKVLLKTENNSRAENARLLSYKGKSFCPLTFGLGYARIATTPRQKIGVNGEE